jgi:hypothetical protein
MSLQHPKRFKQDVSIVIDEAALSDQDTGDEMEQCEVDDDGEVEESSPMDEEGTVDEEKADPIHHVLKPGWVDQTTILDLLPYENHRTEFQQKVEVVEIGKGAEIAFFKALTQGHNRSVDSLARVLGMDMTTFLQTVVVTPILLQGKNGSYANWAVFNGSRKDWVTEMIKHLSVQYQQRPKLMQPLCEMIINNAPLRLYFDIERYVTASEGRSHAETIVVEAFLKTFHAYFNALLPAEHQASAPWISFEEGPFAVASASRTEDFTINGEVRQYHKISFHIVVHALYFKDRATLEVAGKVFADKIGLTEDKPDTQGKLSAGSVVDTTVYANNRNFRLPNTIKIKKPLSLQKPITCASDLSLFFVTYPPDDGTALITMETLEGIKIWQPELKQQRNRTKSVVLRDGDSPDLPIDLLKDITATLDLSKDYAAKKHWKIRVKEDMIFFNSASLCLVNNNYEHIKSPFNSGLGISLTTYQMFVSCFGMHKNESRHYIVPARKHCPVYEASIRMRRRVAQLWGIDHVPEVQKDLGMAFSALLHQPVETVWRFAVFVPDRCGTLYATASDDLTIARVDVDIDGSSFAVKTIDIHGKEEQIKVENGAARIALLAFDRCFACGPLLLGKSDHTGTMMTWLTETINDSGLFKMGDSLYHRRSDYPHVLAPLPDSGETSFRHYVDRLIATKAFSGLQQVWTNMSDRAQIDLLRKLHADKIKINQATKVPCTAFANGIWYIPDHVMPDLADLEKQFVPWEDVSRSEAFIPQISALHVDWQPTFFTHPLTHCPTILGKVLGYQFPVTSDEIRICTALTGRMVVHARYQRMDEVDPQDERRADSYQVSLHMSGPPATGKTLYQTAVQVNCFWGNLGVAVMSESSRAGEGKLVKFVAPGCDAIFLPDMNKEAASRLAKDVFPTSLLLKVLCNESQDVSALYNQDGFTKKVYAPLFMVDMGTNAWSKPLNTWNDIVAWFRRNPTIKFWRTVEQRENLSHLVAAEIGPFICHALYVYYQVRMDQLTKDSLAAVPFIKDNMDAKIRQQHVFSPFFIHSEKRAAGEITEENENLPYIEKEPGAVVKPQDLVRAISEYHTRAKDKTPVLKGIVVAEEHELFKFYGYDVCVNRANRCKFCYQGRPCRVVPVTADCEHRTMKQGRADNTKIEAGTILNARVVIPDMYSTY